MKKKKNEEKILYTNISGIIEKYYSPWDDYEHFGKEIFKNKIKSIKIYFSQEKSFFFKKDKYIIGLSFTYQNIVSRKISIIEHKGNEPFSATKELNLADDEYLTEYFVNYNDKFGVILALGFCTNKNKQIIFGKKEKSDKYINLQDKNSIIVGSFGYLDKKINAIGFLYFEKRIIQKYDFLRLIIVLKYMIKNDKEFVKKIEKKINKFDIVYNCIWRVVNLPDTSFECVIKFFSF